MVEVSEERLQEFSTGVNVSVVKNMTSIDDGFERPLDAGDVRELEESDMNNIHNAATYLIDGDENKAIFTVSIRASALKTAVERRERNDNFPDNVPPEMVLVREGSWIASTINNGQQLIRHIGRVGHGDYTVEVVPRDDEVILNIVFNGEG